MKKTEYLAALKQLDLTVIGAGRVFGFSPRQCQRIAAGDSPVPKPLALLIHLMLKHGITAEELKNAG